MQPRLHHGEAIDPTLWAWIRHQLDLILGLSPLGMVLLLGAVLVAIPVALVALVLLQRRRTRF